MKYPLVKFGDVVRLNTDRVADPQAAGIERYVGLEHITPEDLRIRSWGLVANGTTFTNYFKPGQVLFGKRRAYQRKVAVADFEGVCSSDIYVLEPSDSRLLPELLPYICQTERFYEHAVGTSAGSLSPRTNWSQLAKFEFALPPLEEQRRMAHLIQATDEIIQAYKNAKIEAEIAMRSFVATSLEYPLKGDNCEIVPIDHLGEEGYSVLKTGPFGSSLKSEYFSQSGIPVLNISAVGDVDIHYEGLYYLPEDIAKRFDEYRLTENDIVFSRVAEIGRCILIPTKCEGWIISSNLIRIRLDNRKVNPHYFLYLLKYSRYVQNQIRQVTTGGGRYLINTRTLGKINFPIPSRIYQDEKVRSFCIFGEQSRLIDSQINRAKDLAVTLREDLLIA